MAASTKAPLAMGFLTVEAIKNMGLKFIDIGANLTDSMYRGIYHGSQKHQNDLNDVLDRAVACGVEKIIVTGGSLSDSQEAVKLVEANGKRMELYCTVGCHPTRCEEYADDPDSYTKSLLEVISSNKDKVVAVGECGLDYDRLQFCSQETQKKYFEEQFNIAEITKLPMFFHCRNSSDDFINIVKRNREKFSTGVVHSFTGSKSDIAAIIELDLYIGVNGCSLKTQENIDVMCMIPRDRLMIETDAPWCEVKQTHAGYPYVTYKVESRKKEKWMEGICVNGRNEPGHIVQVLEVMASARGEDICALADAVYSNTKKVFFKDTTCV